MIIPQSIIASNIQRGTILHSDFEGIDHDKFFVVMGISKDEICGFFFINSNIHHAIFNKQELLDMQYIMKKSDYEFLRYDSFLSASSLQERSLHSITEKISNGTMTIIGVMLEDHTKEVVEMVLNSKVISERDKKRFFR